ncbi:Asp23/Gls24 family envelope stress response protein [Natranaerobius trueperi]|uniref:Asp23/Gls24 family envelope stress response protein n=1 Tax=Natranaerobius trueperi TaxID=759412 RepID=A0A226BYD4_9FIRM|nr:Asp23/Gls24 family envelope stress response protein [Natranaerobius trueperi]OWZ84023.1 Asp23/Gls24 family envelope stress response protein [Natranaerobius trueperi]
MDPNSHTMAEKNELGQVRIANNVIGIISYLALKELDGIYNVSGGVSEGISEMFGKKTSKGIKVDLTEENVSIDVNLDIQYGVKIPEISKAAQEVVKEAVENMTGFSVSNVNVYIQRVRFEDV